MKVYTAHLRPGAEPRLVREGFSWLAFIFGPFWLFTQGVLIAGILALALLIALAALAAALPGQPAIGALFLAYALLMGLFGRDLCRWSLTLRGFDQTYVVAARTRDAAFLRLIERDPALLADFRP